MSPFNTKYGIIWKKKPMQLKNGINLNHMIGYNTRQPPLPPSPHFESIPISQMSSLVDWNEDDSIL